MEICFAFRTDHLLDALFIAYIDHRVMQLIEVVPVVARLD